MINYKLMNISLQRVHQKEKKKKRKKLVLLY